MPGASPGFFRTFLRGQRPLRFVLKAKDVFLLSKPKEEKQKNLPGPRYLLDGEHRLLFQQVSCGVLKSFTHFKKQSFVYHRKDGPPFISFPSDFAFPFPLPHSFRRGFRSKAEALCGSWLWEMILKASDSFKDPGFPCKTLPHSQSQYVKDCFT